MRQAAAPHNEHFAQELARLNAQQTRAVDRTEGPVMVLAGPGTGKTHLLAARIGKILQRTDVGAHAVLCLTFTEAGVKAMRERLLSFIGPEAHRVSIHTFHGFCSRVIQDNLQFFGRPGLEPLTELEQVEIIREILDEQPKHTPLKQGYNEEHYYETHLKNLFATMKAERWEVDTVEQAIDQYLRDLPTTEGYFYKVNRKPNRKGDPKVAAIEKETLRMERLRAGARLFPVYQEKLRARRRYDYADMIGWVLRGFEEHPSLLLSYQERFQYLLIDEFQDTNGSQNDIVRKLASYWEQPNLFIVGDDDQAIYEFQGARLESLVEFFRGYQDVEVVTLTDNYRSNQTILDAASDLITLNELRIGNELPDVEINKHLTAANARFREGAGTRVQGEEGIAKAIPLPPTHEPLTPPPLGGPGGTSPLSLLEYPNHTQELTGLLNQLRTWHEAGIPWSEMAILYAVNRQGDRLTLLLERAGIPYRTKRRPNVLRHPTVSNLRDLLTYLRLESERPGTGEHLLYRLLHLRCFATDPYDLARLNLARLQARTDRGIPSWRIWLGRRTDHPSDLRNPEAVYAAADFLERSLGELASTPLTEYVERIANASGLLGTALRRPDRAEQLQHLATFTDFVIAEVARRPTLRLVGLLRTLDQMDGNKIALPLRNHLDQVDAVTLLTAHSAKGLEFEKVWLYDCNDKQWGGGSGSLRNQFHYPPGLGVRDGTKSEEEARRRLFFVALTRAKTEVVMSYSTLDATGRVQDRVLFLEELIAAGSVVATHGRLSAEDVAATAALQLSVPNPDRLPGLERDMIADLLTDFKLSVSSLYAYLDCPVRFFYEKLLRVPDREREKTLYGSALHDALERYFERMVADPQKIFPSKEELLFTFEETLGRRRGLFTPDAFQRRLEQGRTELARYHDTYRSSWTTDVVVEMSVTNVEVDGVPLTGKIDRVDGLGDAYVRVVDYKTSASGGQTRAKLKPPTKKDPYGGTYWRQLTFYKLLLDNKPGELRRVKNAAISFLLLNGEGEQPFAEITFTRKDTDALRAIIKDVWGKIQAQEFTGCGEDDCVWCQFVAGLRGEVPEGVEEGLDDDS